MHNIKNKIEKLAQEAIKDLGSSTEEALIILKNLNIKGVKHSISKCVLTNYLRHKLSAESQEGTTLTIKVIWHFNMRGTYYLMLNELSKKDMTKPSAPATPGKQLFKTDDFTLPNHLNDLAKDFDSGLYPELQN